MNYLRNQRGLTLVETIVALILILLLVAAFAGAMTAGLQREVEVDKRLQASSLARGIIEYLKEDVNLDELDEGENNITSLKNEGFFNDLDDDLFFNFDDDSNIILEKHSVSLVNNGNGSFDSNEMNKITVNIYWHERGRQWSLDLVTFVDGDY